ncbi:hypothetical protein JCM8097_007096 [Rhodosporidiobolus ruineniae]
MSTVDLHALYASRAIAKARTFVNRGVYGGGAGGGSSAGGGGGGSGGSGLSKSPGLGGFVAPAVERQAVTMELNRRDHLGRTVLHLAVSETEPWALDWVELFLSAPMLQVNLTDAESGWSALHRALYVGNIAAARLLLGREDVDTRLKDSEGLSPFDVYNSTVDGTNPTDSLGTANPGRLDLHVWGDNRNYTLGFAGDKERQFPERVQIKREEGGKGLGAFEPLRVKDVSMARLHTGLVTDEKRNNMRLCGYGTGGRLGPTNQTQFTFTPLPDFPHQVSQVVLSPDHTVIITTAGDVFTHGLNRFSQLGYPVDAPAPNGFAKREEDPVQSSPRRVLGALKKEVVLGAAASRTHTVVYTADSVYSWGTNRGQLGYPAAGTPVQVLPRRVTLVQQPVIQLTATENATACLLDSRDVIVLYHEAYLKIVFPLTPFPSRIVAYRPPQVSSTPSIRKISSCGNTFAALSSLGDVFTFTLDSASTGASSKDGTSSPGYGVSRLAPKPQRIWNLRRSFAAATDIGVGLDGSIIICTVSGHAFIRSRKFDSGASKLASTSSAGGSGGGGGFKFARVPYLQRVIRVAANSTGGFAALRADVPLRHIEIEGPTLARDCLSLLPHWQRIGPPEAAAPRRTKRAEEDEDDEDDTDLVIERDIAVASKLMELVRRWDLTWEVSSSGTDAVVNAGSLSIPAHKVVLGARSPALAQHLASRRTVDLDCSPLAALLFLHYLYSDDVPAIWDTRVGLPLRASLPDDTKLDVAAVKLELRHLAQRFDLSALSQSLERHIKTPPAPTLATDFSHLLQLSLSKSPSFPPSLKPDVLLHLADRTVPAHSVVLRARCPFFATFFDDPVWASERRNAGGVVKFDVRHVEWEVMSLVLEHVYRDAGMSLFQGVDRPTADEYIDFTVQVLAVANELLLDKLKAVASAVLRSFVTLHNVVSILCDAAFYEAHDLARACMYFLSSSMETALEADLLGDLPSDLLAALTAFVQERQGAKMPVSRSGLLLQEVLAKHADYLADVDVGRPTGAAKRYRPAIVPNSPKPSSAVLSPHTSPSFGPVKSPRMLPKQSPSLAPVGEVDEPFALDEDFLLDASGAGSGATTPRGGLGLTSPPPQPIGMGRRRSSLAPSTSATPLSSSPSQASYMPLGSPPPQRLQPWSSPAPTATVAAPLDLRSIMASESAAAQQQQGRRGSLASTRPAAVPAASPVAGPSGLSLSASSPSWRPVVASRPSSLADIQSQQASSPVRRPSGPPSGASTPARPAPSPAQRPVASPLTSPPPPAASGPVYTPSRLPPSSHRTPSGSLGRASSAATGPRSSFSGSDAPWQNYDALPLAPSPALAPAAPAFDPFSPPSAPARSFAEIQSEQAAAGAAVKSHQAPRSFAQLMREDQARKKREEEEEREAREFARWFEEESRRVQAEQAALRQAVNGGGGGGGGGKKKGKGGGGGQGAEGGKGKGKGKKPAPPPAALANPAEARIDDELLPSTSSQPASGASTPRRGGGGGGGGGRGRGRGRGGSRPAGGAGGGDRPVPSPPPGVKV